MTQSHDPTSGANLPSDPLPPAVDWADPIQVRAWLDAARTTVDDLAALAREGSRRFKHRVLSRPERRRKTRETERALDSLFEAAFAGLPASPPERGDTGA